MQRVGLRSQKSRYLLACCLLLAVGIGTALWSQGGGKQTVQFTITALTVEKAAGLITLAVTVAGIPTSQSFTIPISPNSIIVNTGTFYVVLSAPVNCTVSGTNGNVTVTIIGNSPQMTVLYTGDITGNNV